MLFRHNWEIQTRPTIGKIPFNGSPEDLANTLYLQKVIHTSANLQLRLPGLLKDVFPFAITSIKGLKNTTG